MLRSLSRPLPVRRPADAGGCDVRPGVHARRVTYDIALEGKAAEYRDLIVGWAPMTGMARGLERGADGDRGTRYRVLGFGSSRFSSSERSRDGEPIDRAVGGLAVFQLENAAARGAVGREEAAVESSAGMSPILSAVSSDGDALDGCGLDRRESRSPAPKARTCCSLSGRSRRCRSEE